MFPVWFLVGNGFPCVCVPVFVAAGEFARSFSAGILYRRGHGPGGWGDGLSDSAVYGLYGQDDLLLSFS